MPTVAAPVQKTAAAPRRMRMRKFTARSAAWWLRWGNLVGTACWPGEESEGMVPEEG